MKPKILLINPSLTGLFSAGIGTVKVPLGLAYIAAYLEKYGYEVKIIDCVANYENVKHIKNDIYRIGLSEDRLAQSIKEYNPQIVGISCSFTIYEEDSFRIAKIVKENSDALVVVGGAHSSANPESALKCKDIDLAVIGEGELTFLEIIKNYKNYKKIDGIAFRTKNGVKKNHAHKFIKDLDEIPFPARHLLPMEKYLKHPQNSMANMRGPTTEIISSRGCPFTCIFCSICSVWGRKWRARSAKNVVDELEQLQKNYGIREFRFFDDNISWNKKRMSEICDEIIKRKLDIRWDTPNGVAIATLDENILRKMKQAGYYKIIMGIESGSEETLRFMRKPVGLEHARKIIKICNKLGIWTWSTFVIGFPNETREEIQKTIDFAKKSGLNFVTFYIAQPYPGTEMYEIYRKEGLLKKGIKKTSTVTHTEYDTNYFKAEELREIQKKAYSEFIKYRLISYLNPIKLYNEFLNRIRSFEDFFYVIRMGLNLIGKEYSPIYKK